MRRLWGLWGLVLLLVACGTDQGLPAEPLRLDTKLPPAYLGEPYRTEVLAAGGVRPYAYEARGDLPPGLRFAGGRIAGTPTKKGTYRFEVTVRDAALGALTRTFTLTVGDPPPPRFDHVLPPAETDAAFVWLARLKGRPTLGFSASFRLRDLVPDLKTLRVAKGALYVVRYRAKERVLDLDVAFPAPFQAGEAFRVVLDPAKKLRPAVQATALFLDAKGRPFPASKRLKLKRPGAGRYHLADLVAVARNWGQKQKGKAPLEGDLNADGRVDAKDLALLRAGYDWADPLALEGRPAEGQGGEQQKPQGQKQQKPPVEGQGEAGGGRPH